MAPVEAPLQLTLVLEDVAETAGFWVMVVEKLPVQPFTSVITNE